jgi:hypothetical protein
LLLLCTSGLPPARVDLDAELVLSGLDLEGPIEGNGHQGSRLVVFRHRRQDGDTVGPFGAPASLPFCSKVCREKVPSGWISPLTLREESCTGWKLIVPPDKAVPPL